MLLDARSRVGSDALARTANSGFQRVYTTEYIRRCDAERLLYADSYTHMLALELQISEHLESL